MAWWDTFKLFTYASEEDPITKSNRAKEATGAGVIQPDAIPDVRQDGSYWGGGSSAIRLRDTNDFIDLSTVSNRASRYKEYERLRSIPEIEMAMTVFADESCLIGSTPISTVMNGAVTLSALTEQWAKNPEPFLVYCWDFSIGDYTIGWASEPRLVKKERVVKITLDDGSTFSATVDHRVLMRNGSWKMAGDIKQFDELMPFYRVKPNAAVNKLKVKQFPRIFTHNRGWIHERQFIDEWRTGKKAESKLNKVNKAARYIAGGIGVKKTAEAVGHQWATVAKWLKEEGFMSRELKLLGRKADRRRVVGVQSDGVQDVYDLSVKDHENFCGESCIFHNCQKGDNNHAFDIKCKNKEIKEELDFVMLHRRMLNLDRRTWDMAKNLYIQGDLFIELITNPENPKDGILGIQKLPAESMYRIETTKGKLVEFQQSKEGPDYESLTRAPLSQATDAEIMQSRSIRFAPNQIVHIRIGDDRKTFYPYGQSLIEPARGPAHQLRLMEDAMIVYRLVRAPERRVFYIDIGNLSGSRAEAFVERMKDQFRKKKTASGSARTQTGGASAVEERWHAPSSDEDYWVPVRTGGNTRIETLPGAQNLGEIDDAVYFRNKLFTALNFPKNYFSTEDVQATRISLSAQDVRFARQIERMQGSIEDGLWQIADTHLRLRGFPEEMYEDLVIRMTPPSEWRELSRAEIVSNRIQNATSLKGSMLYSDYDILTQCMKKQPEEANEILSRLKLQKLEDLKLQILASNPQLLGVGVPDSGDKEIGAESSGPNNMLSPDGATPPPDAGSEGGEQTPPPENGGAEQAPASNSPPLAEPTADELKKYDMQVQTYSVEADREEQDYSQNG